MNPIQLFSTDLDGTILGNAEATVRFREFWNSFPEKTRPVLVYNSGRMVDDMRALLEEGLLPQPDWLVGGVGTQIFDCRTQQEDKDFEKDLSSGWDLEKVEKVVSGTPGIKCQPPEFLHPYKSSWYLERAAEDVIRSLEKNLAKAGLQVVVVYSSARDLDVLPAFASKGNVIRRLCERLQINAENVVVAGDTGNDSTMFQVEGVRGIVVANSQPELFQATISLPVYVALRTMADGVVEGLQYFGLEAVETSAPQNITPEVEPGMRILFDEGAYSELAAEERDLIREGYDQALIAVRKNITHMGYSACSLEDNESNGADANYKSVWARDGAITVICTMDETAEDIRTASRRTLCTLLDLLTPNGQIPSNVRIEDGVPDYSGTGGIASIDSGLWVVIAVYQYMRRTKDFDFLNQYAGTLQKAMDWLSAHDSNNDGLLEIPEAGDWTDLFGRSYNVLYDEVLWYRANVCYGLLLELRGDSQRASDYLAWAQKIRGELLVNFWPSTTASAEDKKSITWADQQFSLGDSQFMLAQISPFSFSWRCDVFGNVLAFLYNVLDIERARTAFKFMWGVGVNEPWPAANLYPVVQSGDPDWKNYYTINLLNLPHHYHNGGIWPLVGGMWVRFIYRLGLGNIAARELARLAAVNKLGKDSEWEFNEWMHGTTGRPMGKRFQAWSAASYIRACHELRLDPGHDTQD